MKFICFILFLFNLPLFALFDTSAGSSWSEEIGTQPPGYPPYVGQNHLSTPLSFSIELTPTRLNEDVFAFNLKTAISGPQECSILLSLAPKDRPEEPVLLLSVDGGISWYSRVSFYYQPEVNFLLGRVKRANQPYVLEIETKTPMSYFKTYRILAFRELNNRPTLHTVPIENSSVIDLTDSDTSEKKILKVAYFLCPDGRRYDLYTPHYFTGTVYLRRRCLVEIGITSKEVARVSVQSQKRTSTGAHLDLVDFNSLNPQPALELSFQVTDNEVRFKLHPGCNGRNEVEHILLIQAYGRQNELLETFEAPIIVPANPSFSRNP